MLYWQTSPAQPHKLGKPLIASRPALPLTHAWHVVADGVSRSHQAGQSSTVNSGSSPVAQHPSERLSSFRKPLSASGAHDIPFHRAVLRCLCRYRWKSPACVLGLHNRASHHFSGVQMYGSTCTNHPKSLLLGSDTPRVHLLDMATSRLDGRPSHLRRQPSQSTARCLVRAGPSRGGGRACVRAAFMPCALL